MSIFHEITSMYQCIFIHILCRREAAISWIYSFDAIEVLGRETSIIIIWIFVLSLLEHKNVFTHINNVGLVAHSYFNNFNYHLERKKETFLAILYRRLIQKMVKKLGVFEFWNIFFLYVLFSCKNFPFWNTK